eukprot:gene14874-15011_t
MMPHFEEDELDLPISRLAMALAAVANKLLDDEWVNALMAEAYPPENDGEDTDEEPALSSQFGLIVMVELQFQDSSGHWRTIEVLASPFAGQVSLALKNLKEHHPDWRVRAIDENGHLLDML